MSKEDDEIVDEINDTQIENRPKNMRQYQARQALEARLEEIRLNKLLNLEQYVFDDGDGM